MNRTKNHIDSVAMKFKFACMALPDEREAANDFCIFFLKMLYELEGPEIDARVFFTGRTPFLSNYALYTLPADHGKFEEDLRRYRFFSLGIDYFGKKKLNAFKKKPSERAFEVFDIFQKNRNGQDVQTYADKRRKMLFQWFMGHDAQLSDLTLPFSEYGQVSILMRMSYGSKADYDEGMLNGERQITRPLVISAWLPRFLTGSAFSAEQQQRFSDGLHKLCQAYPTSMAVMDSEMFYGAPLRFSIHDELRPIKEYDFSSMVPGIGWGLCLSKAQIDRLGGFAAIDDAAPINNLVRYKHGGGMLQLTPDINNISRESLLTFRDYLNPFLPHGEFSTSCQYLLDTYCRLPIREEDLAFCVTDNSHVFPQILL